MQRSFDDLGTPLRDVTFCVVDLETTGSSAEADTITEIGAVKVRGGECLGVYHTLVNPGRAIPPQITMLTGITESMVCPAPRVEEVLPSFVEFSAGTVLVGHNVRFDVSFLDAALQRDRWPRLTHPRVDTAALARRLLRDEVPDCRLGTLASRLRLDHKPTHRALDDALATTDLLHLLLERGAAFGVLGLDDLLALPRMDAHPQAAKLRLTTRLPRSPGVYLFVGPRDEVLYVGKATNLRQRVRSYFSTDERRKVHGLLREATSIRHQACTSTLEAAVTEIRLIHRHQPRYNRQGRRTGAYHYVKLTLREAYPRLAVVRAARQDGSLYLGPLPSAGAAKEVIDAIQTVVPIRRCSLNLGRCGEPVRSSPCTPAQLGVASCPCSGQADRDEYDAAVACIVRGLSDQPSVLLQPLEARMAALASAERFEEAADLRQRAAALAGALRRQRQLDGLRRAGTLRVTMPSGAGAEVSGGLLRVAWAPKRQHEDDSGQATLDLGPELLATGPTLPDATAPTLPRATAGTGALPDAPDLPPPGAPLPHQFADEVGVIAAWLDAEAGRLRIEHCDGEFAWPTARLPAFTPRR